MALLVNDRRLYQRDSLMSTLREGLPMITGISMVKDEADIIGRTVEHMLAQGVDHLIIADNLSTDGTREILESFPEVTVVNDPEPGYYQSVKMTRLARRAYIAGATWIVPFDADEFWTWPLGTLDDLFSLTNASILYAASYEQLGSYRARDAKSLPKVAFRADPGAVLKQGSHDVTGIQGTAKGGPIIREYQYRSLEQLVRKVRNGKAAYDATNLPAYEGAHWRQYGALTDGELADLWAQMNSRTDMIHDPFRSSSRPLAGTIS